MSYSVETLFSEPQVRLRISELGKRISARYHDSDKEIVLVGLLRGSFMFMADLCRAIKLPHKIDFITASSYGSAMSSCREVKIIKDLDEDICNKHVLIVEDIIDSGYTLDRISGMLSSRRPASLAICTLLDKPSRREVMVNVDYVGFSIPDEFVVGYGIDYAQHYRYLPYIGRIVMHSE